MINTKLSSYENKNPIRTYFRSQLKQSNRLSEWILRTRFDHFAGEHVEDVEGSGILFLRPHKKNNKAAATMPLGYDLLAFKYLLLAGLGFGL